MESPFFRKPIWKSPLARSSPTTRGIPVQHQATTKPSTPKVVSIPVHFVGTEKTRLAAAQKIQKVFRGFLMRKSLKKIVGIRSEVDEIERRISQRETIDLIRRDAKERLKVNETLMALLFRLDSVRGVGSGIRDCRKAVIKKAISWQERVDAIVAGDKTLDPVDGGETMDQSKEESSLSECITEDETDAETKDFAASSEDNFANGVNPNSETGKNEAKVVDGTMEAQDPSESVLNSSNAEPILEASYENSAEVFKTKYEDEEACSPEETIKNSEPTSSSHKFVEENVNTEKTTETTEIFSENSQSLVLKDEGETLEKHEDDDMEVRQPNLIQRQPVEERERCPGSNRDLMERMIEDNEKLMGLMTELFERNAMQTSLISSLSQRVEELERASRNERLRRKKKRQATGTVEKPESTPDARKCGRKL